VLSCPRSRLSRYAVAVLAVAVTLVLRRLLWPFLGSELPFLHLWPAVVIAAGVGGLGPGLLATLLAALSEDFLLNQPDFFLMSGNPAEVVGIALFGLLGTLTSFLIERTRRAQAQAEAIAQEAECRRERLRVILASIGDGVIVTNQEGRIDFLNPVAQTLTGWKEEEALGQPLENVFHIRDRDSDMPLAWPIRQALRQGATVGLAGRASLVARQGTRTPVECTAAPIRWTEGSVLGVVLSFRDFSEQVRLEGELRRRAEELADTDRRKDHFLAMLAHELRNPLTPIRNVAQMLRLPGHDAERTRWAAEVLDRQVGQMSRLVEDLLDVARIRQGKVRLQREVVELTEVVERAIENSRPLLQVRLQELVENLPTEPLWLEADPVRLAQVLANLLTNASKYTPERGRITLTATCEDRWAVVRVRDTGAGIPAEMLPRVFDLFAQVEGTRDQAQGGLGIGLTLVRDLVRLHGGTVEAFSEGPGQGSEFVVRLPLTRLAVSPSPQEPPASEVVHLTARRILVVDDNTDTAESLALLLRLAGHDTCTAADGPTALATARVFRPEIVLLDIGLPGMDGHEVARQLRQERGGSGLLLIAVTGYEQAADKRRARDAGFDHYLVKPVNLAALCQLVGLTLAPRGGGRPFNHELKTNASAERSPQAHG
jgi:PAS domain S-box-containing protein